MSKCWYCNNELTSGDSPKHFGICNKCYDEMFKSSDTIISSFTNKISDLEAKLAESEKKYAELFCRNIELETLYSQKTALLNFYKDTDLVEKNQQLKQQLDESEKQRQHLKDWLDNEILTSVDNESYYATINEYEEEVKKLKQQLAEKDKEISNLNGLVRERDKQIKNLKTNKKRVIEHKNKTKISFAVEQLEKVKRTFIDVAWEDVDFAIEIIDDQIKELKGEK